jgi:DNA repair exonuclease SbcCD ATPase subunit
MALFFFCHHGKAGVLERVEQALLLFQLALGGTISTATAPPLLLMSQARSGTVRYQRVCPLCSDELAESEEERRLRATRRIQATLRIPSRP